MGAHAVTILRGEIPAHKYPGESGAGVQETGLGGKGAVPRPGLRRLALLTVHVLEESIRGLDHARVVLAGHRRVGQPTRIFTRFETAVRNRWKLFIVSGSSVSRAIGHHAPIESGEQTYTWVDPKSSLPLLRNTEREHGIGRVAREHYVHFPSRM